MYGSYPVAIKQQFNSLKSSLSKVNLLSSTVDPPLPETPEQLQLRKHPNSGLPEVTKIAEYL